MSEEQKAGIAFIAATIVLAVVMAAHPTGGELSDAGSRFEARALVATAVHSLAILALPVLFYAAFVLTRRLRTATDVASIALVVFGFALVAGMCAAAVSGYIAPEVLRRLARESSAGTGAETWRELSRYTFLVNQAFARILTLGTSVAILLWSVSLSRPATLRSYGLVSSVLIIGAVGTASLRLDLHAFAIVTLLHGIWYFAVGVLMLRERPFLSPEAASRRHSHQPDDYAAS